MRSVLDIENLFLSPLWFCKQKTNNIIIRVVIVEERKFKNVFDTSLNSKLS